jgi:hypothetical protein
VCRDTDKSFNREPILAATDPVSNSTLLFNSRCETTPLYSQAVSIDMTAASTILERSLRGAKTTAPTYDFLGKTAFYHVQLPQ